jgi:hypothetical protein
MLRTVTLLSLIAATPAMAFQARNTLMVQGSEARITVAPSAGQAAPQSWCAAGDFVIRALGRSPTTPVYRISQAPRRAGQGVEFSLQADGAAAKSGLIEFGTDAAITAGHAQALCWIGRDK